MIDHAAADVLPLFGTLNTKRVHLDVIIPQFAPNLSLIKGFITPYALERLALRDVSYFTELLFHCGSYCFYPQERPFECSLRRGVCNQIFVNILNLMIPAANNRNGVFLTDCPVTLSFEYHLKR